MATKIFPFKDLCEDGERVLSLKRVEGGVRVREECDKYYSVVLTPTQVEDFALELYALSALPEPQEDTSAARTDGSDWLDYATTPAERERREKHFAGATVTVVGERAATRMADALERVAGLLRAGQMQHLSGAIIVQATDNGYTVNGNLVLVRGAG